jgi:SAM-dependent methyltransferase
VINRLSNTIGFRLRHFRIPARLEHFHDPKFPGPTLKDPISQLCTESQFFTKTYNDWCAQIKEEPLLHRKQWEYAYILQAMRENDLLRSNRTGLGFGIGKEPLPAVMVNHGCSLLVSDLDEETADAHGWVETNQFSDGLSGLNERGICGQSLFKQQVTYQTIDMNRIPESVMQEEFDFVWSSCSLEHLGSLPQSIEFVLNSLRCLKPGGIAIHTTEYNISSNWDTLDRGSTVLLRRRDIAALQMAVSKLGCRMSFNPNYGDGPHDLSFDEFPYASSPHVKLLIGPYVCTSVGLIIRKSK